MSRLVSHKNKAIFLRTKIEYQQLMTLFEKEGWRWSNGSLPTSYNAWGAYKENFCVDYTNWFGFADCEHFKEIGYEVITLEEVIKHWNGGHLLWLDYNEPFKIEVQTWES